MGRRPQISRASILEVARTIANEDGLGAVTMQGVGQVLEVTAMALYRHVPNKTALVDGMVGLVYEDITLPPPDLPWRERVLGIGDGIRRAGGSNPGLAGLLAHHPPPEGAAFHLHLMLGDALDDGGIPRTEGGRVAQVVLTTFLGFAARSSGRRHDRAKELKDLDVEFAMTRAMVGQLLDDAVPSGRRRAPRSQKSRTSS